MDNKSSKSNVSPKKTPMNRNVSVIDFAYISTTSPPVSKSKQYYHPHWDSSLNVSQQASEGVNKPPPPPRIQPVHRRSTSNSSTTSALALDDVAGGTTDSTTTGSHGYGSIQKNEGNIEASSAK
ncbi:hypothetical protein EJ08DRAFT_658892 [Tothia fuscella]|uniref:Uncharacterized protein n=1 Tax=Tothia fuscella TaxID=1048955 RepID=A0A9P4U0K7_9PEZI|nr:hypothetical protein EJ08DRAFT_658892 [Tothia fuscella]